MNLQLNKNKAKDTIKAFFIKYWPSFLLFILTFVFYFAFRSISYDDWDSIQFALGIKDFSLELHQPHSPGYPVYIFILKLLDAVIRNPLNTMTLVSAISGSVGVVAFYFLVQKLFSLKKHSAFISALLLGFFPLFAINSVKALSDVLSTTLYIAWLFVFIIVYRKLKPNSKGKIVSATISTKTTPSTLHENLMKWLIGLGILSGISIGVRIQIVVAMLIPLLIILYSLLKSKHYKLITALILSGILSTLSWMIPVIIDSGGVSKFVDLMLGRYIWRYEIHAHTPFEYGFSIPYFIEHAISHVYNLVRGGLGFSLPYGQFGEAPRNIYIICFLLVFIIFSLTIYILIRNRKKEKSWLFLISGVPYGFFMYLNLTYENPRYWLPLIPFLIMGGIWGASQFNKLLIHKFGKTGKTAKPAYLIKIFGLLILAIFAFKSYELATILHNEKSSPTKAVEYIQQTYGEEDTVFLNCTHMNWRHFQYLTKREMPFYDEYSQEDILKLVSENPQISLISCQCYNTSTVLTDFQQVDTISFYRDLRAHWKHNYLEICKFERK